MEIVFWAGLCLLVAFGAIVALARQPKCPAKQRNPKQTQQEREQAEQELPDQIVWLGTVLDLLEPTKDIRLKRSALKNAAQELKKGAPLAHESARWLVQQIELWLEND